MHTSEIAIKFQRFLSKLAEIKKRAKDGNRTRNPSFTKAVLCRLSYFGFFDPSERKRPLKQAEVNISDFSFPVKGGAKIIFELSISN